MNKYLEKIAARNLLGDYGKAKKNGKVITMISRKKAITAGAATSSGAAAAGFIAGRTSKKNQD